MTVSRLSSKGSGRIGIETAPRPHFVTDGTRVHHGKSVVKESRAPYFATFIAFLLVTFAFGPYIADGLRTEQIMVYALAAISSPNLLVRNVWTKTAAPILAIWALLCIAVLSGSVFPPINTSLFASGQLLAGLDNVSGTLAVMITMISLRLGNHAADFLRRISLLVVVMMCINTMASIATVVTGRTWAQFWSSDLESSAERALTQNRVSGLINQPAEAGVLYAVASLCALYALRTKPRWLLASLTFLFVGAVMSVSKVYLLVGLPLIAWQLVRIEDGRAKRAFWIAVTGSLLLLAGQLGVLSRWKGAEQLDALLNRTSGGSWLEWASANRFGGRSTIRPVVQAVLDGPMFLGYGGRGLAIAYDNAFVEALVLGGLVGVALLVLLFIYMARMWRRAGRSPERTLLGALILLMAGAAMGLPVFTANRVSTVLWVVVFGTLAALPLHASQRRPSLAGQEAQEL